MQGDRNWNVAQTATPPLSLVSPASTRDPREAATEAFARLMDGAQRGLEVDGLTESDRDILIRVYRAAALRVPPGRNVAVLAADTSGGPS